MFLASVLGLKNECFCSNSEAVSPSPGLQPPPLMLSPPPQNNTDPLDMETHSHPRTHNSHTCIHTKCSYTPTHTQITYSHTQAYTHSHVVIHSNHIYMAHNSLAHSHTHRISPALTEKIQTRKTADATKKPQRLSGSAIANALGPDAGWPLVDGATLLWF